MPSAAQTYTVSGSYLTDSITVTAPTGFQVSTDGTNYFNSLTLPQSGGAVASATIYARLYSTVTGSYSGSITHTSPGATQKDVAVSGTVSDCITASFEASADTYMDAGAATTNYGGSSTLLVNGDPDYGMLLKWDLSSIPAGAEVSGASVSLYVVNQTANEYPLYALRQSWTESEATWNGYAGTSSWGTAGAQDTSTDRNNTNLWNATTTNLNSTGSRTMDLNPDGITAVQGWINNPSSNFGVTIQNYSATDGLDVASREDTANPGPTLNVSYCYSAGPTIITSVSSLSPFSTPPGTPSAAQTYTVRGRNLAGGILITSPAGFQVSTDGSTYDDSLTLPQSGGTVTTTIYARLTGAAQGDYSGSITHTSAGAITKDVAVSGSVAPITCDTVHLEAAADTSIQSWQEDMNYGASTTLDVSPFTSYPRGSLFWWNVSGLPATARVSAASLTFQVTDASAYAFILYQMRRSWVEGTGPSGVENAGATWNSYDGTNNWGTAGAQDTSSDRYNTPLWDATAADFGTAGNKEIALNASGITVVEGWISGSVANYGLTVQNYTASGSADLWTVASHEHETLAGPTLKIIYCYPSTKPVIRNLAPTDNATGVHNPPNLSVNVYDSNSDSLAVTFYGRPVMEPSGEWASIGSVNVTGATASGGVLADIDWPGRTVGVEYEWYATVSDGTYAVTGLTWSFAQGSPTAANLSYFRAYRTPAGVELSWETASEETTGGFNLLRSDDGGETFGVKVNQTIIPPQLQAAGSTYTFFDPGADPRQYYLYRLACLDLDLEEVQMYQAGYWPYHIALPLVVR